MGPTLDMQCSMFYKLNILWGGLVWLWPYKSKGEPAYHMFKQEGVDVYLIKIKIIFSRTHFINLYYHNTQIQDQDPPLDDLR